VFRRFHLSDDLFYRQEGGQIHSSVTPQSGSK